MPGFPAYYRDGYSPSKNFTRQLATEDSYYFAQDSNEAFSAERHARRGIADALFADGQVVRGAGLIVDAGAVSLEAGVVYVQGAMRELPASGFAISTAGDVLVGVIIETRVVTHVDDPSLVFQNFPDKAFESHGMPRAPWVQEKPRWGHSGEVLIDTAEVSYSFFPVYTVREGQLVDTTPPSEAGAFVALVERYDRESNGHYITRGLKVTYLGTPAGAQIYSLADGTANVEGRKIDRPAAQRLTYVEDPDFERINAEPHLFEDGGTGTFVIHLNRTPVETVHDVSVLAEKTVTVQRGQSTGGRDPLPDAQIQQIITINQGGTTYNQGADFTRLGDEVNWAPTGAEPAPGSTYQVTYRYKRSIAPVAVSENSVTVSGAVTGSEVDVDYSWKMPRFDVLALNRANEIVRIKGVASPYNPQRPRVPAHLLELAQIEQGWTDDYPLVRHTGIQAVPVGDLELMREAIVENRRGLADVRLASEASVRNPAATNGIFIDNFDNDAQRDAGIAQTASIVGGRLTLSIAAQLEQVATGGDGWTLDYTLEPAITQTLITRGFKINPYQSFAPVPAQVTLHPSIDEWQEVQTQWASPVTRTFTTSGSTTRSTSEELLRSSTTELANLRVRDVDFAIAGFGPGEALSSLTFDGLDVLALPAPIADGSGSLSGAFTVPANMPAGSYTVQAIGAGGSAGQATYTGRGTITIEERRRVTTVFQNFDPVYQSFTPTEGFHLAAWGFRFATIGERSEQVVVQLRDAVQGVPGRTVLAEAIIDMTGAGTMSDTLATFANLPWCAPGEEKTIVWLTNDPDHAIAVAELGKFDAAAQRWVTAQPYQIGVFGSSSNNRAWTIHQEFDAYFKAYKAKMTSASRTVQLGTIAAVAVTDLIGLAGVDIPEAATAVDLIFVRPNGQQIKVAPGAVVSLPSALTEDLIVKAVLRGTNSASPILFPDPLVVLGALSATDDYVSRAFTCGNDRTVRVELRGRFPGASSVEVAIQKADLTWQVLTLASNTDVGDGWRDYAYEVESFSAVTTRARLVLNGTALNRPEVEHLVVMPLAL